MLTRSEAKEETRQRLLSAARETLQDSGATAVTLRDVARRAGVVPSAVYRHFDSRDALLTQLILDAYGSLAVSLEGAVTEPGSGWREAADGLRAWALAHRHEFLLIYGTPVPGYRAPAETIPAAARVAAVFVMRASAARGRPPDSSSALQAQLAAAAGQFGVQPHVLARALADLSQLVGLLVLELGGHFVGSADPADHLWEAVVAEQAR